MVVRIEAPHFVAGIVLDVDLIAIRTAPILRWMQYKHLGDIALWVAKKGYKLWLL